jgi:hypothetical protein
MVKKSILRRIKWDNVAVVFTWIVAIICIGYMCYSTKSYAVTTTDGLVRHSYTLQVGDTIWDVASNVSTSNDDVREVVYKILEDNKISNPSAVQPGQTIYIYLERKQ